MRKRLTARNVRAESQADGLFPGDIGNEERAKNYRSLDEYSNYEYQEGWDIPEENTEPIKDERDEMNIGISKTASKYRLAKHASILAQLCLGDDCDDDVLEDQARDFMKMGDDAIVASIRRWKATEPAPEMEDNELENEEIEADEDELEVGEDEIDTDEKESEIEADEDEDIDELESEDVDELESEEESEIEADEDDAPEMEIEIPEVADDNAEEMFSNESELTQAQPDPELVALFNGEENIEETPVTASKKVSKQGIKRLAGQPKLVASANNLKELDGLWDNLKLPRL